MWEVRINLKEIINPILVVGGSGFLGSKLMAHAKLLDSELSVVGTYHTTPFSLMGCKTIWLDLRRRHEVERVIQKYQPSCVIHTAAIRDLDWCETHMPEAWAINVEGTRNLAYACSKQRIKLIYISTDSVFDGEKHGYYTETDVPKPISYYGRTKLEGENIVRGLCYYNHAIVRVSLLYGWPLVGTRTNFVTWVIEKLKNNEPVKLYEDQYRNLTYVDNAALAILHIFSKDLRGIYHVTGADCVTRYTAGKKIALVFDFDPELVVPIKFAEDRANRVAARPLRLELDNRKAVQATGIKLIGLDEGLQTMKNTL
jgi:dTDP-4-dehydrorhamnose reductase